jgi:hypothetical protein
MAAYRPVMPLSDCWQACRRASVVVSARLVDLGLQSVRVDQPDTRPRRPVLVLPSDVRDRPASVFQLYQDVVPWSKLTDDLETDAEDLVAGRDLCPQFVGELARVFSPDVVGSEIVRTADRVR